MLKVKSKYYIITDASKRLYGVFTGNLERESEIRKAGVKFIFPLPNVTVV